MIDLKEVGLIPIYWHRVLSYSHHFFNCMNDGVSTWKKHTKEKSNIINDEILYIYIITNLKICQSLILTSVFTRLDLSF